MEQSTGNLFVAMGLPGVYTMSGGSSLTSAPKVFTPGVNSAADGRVCAGGPTNNCFGGVQVLDGSKLEVTRTIPFRALQLDGFVTQSVLRAMSLAPATDTRGAKLYYVVEEKVASPVFFDAVPRYNGGNVQYLVQTDVTSGAQEWTLRLDGCRYPREPNNGGGNSVTDYLPSPTAVFRADQPSGSAVYVGCHSSSAQTGSVLQVPLDSEDRPAVLPIQPRKGTDVADEVVDSQSAPAGGVGSTDGAVATFTGPDRVTQIEADASAQRILMRVVAGVPLAEVWWVFDASKLEFIGTIGIGKYDQDDTMNAFDPQTGRLYILAPASSGFSGGLLIVDTRRQPLPQPLVFPSFAPLPKQIPLGMVVESAIDGRAPRVYYRESTTRLAALVDNFPSGSNGDEASYSGRTLDLDEVEGATAVAFDGAARGYGVRALLVGGLEAVGRAGPVDVGQVEGSQRTEAINEGGFLHGTVQLAGAKMPLFANPCGRSDREIVVASIGPKDPVILDGGGARGVAQPFVIDSGLRADVESPISRCSTKTDWAALWSTGLFGRPPVDEPQPEWPLADSDASCVASDAEQTDSWGDPVGGFLSARVSCSSEEASGWSQARSVGLDSVDVAQASSSFRVYRDPSRGLVARVESFARGVGIDGVIRIETIRGVAEAWANGRRQPIAAADREAGYNPVCDFERTAGTCFRTSLTGLYTPEYRCGACDNEKKVIEAINKAMGANGRARMRQPDPALAKGAENGFIAAVQKPDHERFADITLNTDLLQTVVPALEIIRYAPSNRPPAIGAEGSRGRQIFQFAGVEVSTSYGIQCILVYDPDSGICGLPKQEPGSLTVKLTDGDDKPLAGGAFEVREDVDADGVVGLVDTLLPDGACVTAADGIGTCVFEKLPPGSYLVTQTAAPEGFAKVDDTWVSEVASGEARTVAFTNTSNVSSIDVSAVDEAGKPVSGAVFAVFADPDADGKVAADAKPVATCTTGGDGKCSMRVPVGSYVLVQQSAPKGLEGIEPVAFAFASGGQTAAVGVTNYGAGIPDVEPAAGPVYTEPVNYSPPVETVDTYTPPIDDGAGLDTTPLPQVMGDTIVRIIKAPGDAVRLLSRDPQQAVAWIASLALFLAAGLVVRRRQHAIKLTNQ